jgi:hypothetical protein
MRDLDIAKKRLNENGLTLSIVKNGEMVFETTLRGVSGFLEAVEKFRNKLEGASVADRIVGKAIALLCVYTKVKAIYAKILSKNAKEVLEGNTIYHEWKFLVENILCANKTELCPFEKIALKISNPKDAYEKLKAQQVSMRH